MGHHITAIVVVDPFDPKAAQALDLVGVPLIAPLTLFHVDHHYTAYWQARRGVTTRLDVPQAFPAIFPREGIVTQVVAELTGVERPRFALIQTDYFGGIGDQWACAFSGAQCRTYSSINAALRFLGVVRTTELDEFDTVGLGAHRSAPEHLERYIELCDQLGV